jgi:small subunit ribosomal protein S13
MPRILGVDIPREKRIDAALPYLYGIGRVNAVKILTEANIEFSKRAKDLSDEEVARITAVIQSNYLAEGELRREVSENIKRMMDSGNYRGLRHRKGLPVRGQRTKTNAKTRKGRKSATSKLIKAKAN